MSQTVGVYSELNHFCSQNHSCRCFDNILIQEKINSVSMKQGCKIYLHHLMPIIGVLSIPWKIFQFNMVDLLETNAFERANSTRVMWQWTSITHRLLQHTEVVKWHSKGGKQSAATVCPMKYAQDLVLLILSFLEILAAFYLHIFCRVDLLALLDYGWNTMVQMVHGWYKWYKCTRIPCLLLWFEPRQETRNPCTFVVWYTLKGLEFCCDMS